MEYNENMRHPISATLMLTKACNLHCKYCFIDQSKGTMTLDMAKQIIDSTYQNLIFHQLSATSPLRKNKRIKIIFFGGEPLLLWEKIIKPCIEYGKKKYKEQICFSITTNGSLLTPEISDFLIQNDTHITFSIDGPQVIQDENRPQWNDKGSYNLIINNLKYILKKYTSKDILIRSTIFHSNINNLYDIYKFFDDLNVKNYNFQLDVSSQWANEEYNILQQEINKICFYRLQQILQGITPMANDFFDQLLSECYLIFSNRKNIEQLKIQKINNRPKIYRCGLGTINHVIDMNGNIFTCVTQTKQTKDNIFCIGNINNQTPIDQYKHKKLLSIYNNEIFLTNIQEKRSICQECLYNILCLKRTNSCLTIGYDYKNILNQYPEYINCKLIETIFRNSFIELSLLSYYVKNDNSCYKNFWEELLKNQLNSNDHYYFSSLNYSLYEKIINNFNLKNFLNNNNSINLKNLEGE